MTTTLESLMNLSGDPWVPVLFRDGAHRLVSLTDAFRLGEDIADLVATPPQRIALTRLLVCITQAALDGPADEDAWRGCRGRLAVAAVSYLGNHRACFDLYGQPGFLQLPNIKPTDNAVLDKLDFRLAAGNNATLFDHGAVAGGRQHGPEWYALMLLTYQCFSPGGTMGTSEWDESETSSKSLHAPCLEGSMLHTLLRGRCLLDTIHLNCVTRRALEAMAGVWGRAIWDADPQGPGRPGVREATGSYLGRLVPVSRAVKLSADGARITLIEGCRYPKLPAYREPAATVHRRKDGALGYVGIDLSKHPWRELASVLALSRPSAEGGPLALDHLRGLDPSEAVDIWTGGMAADQGKVVDVAEWTFHLPVKLLGDTALKAYQEGVATAERASGSLAKAAASYFDDLGVGEFKRKEGGKFQRNDPDTRKRRRNITARAAALYWRSLDAQYVRLVDAATNPNRDFSAWYEAIRTGMESAYEQACPHRSPRQLRAYAKGAQCLKVSRRGGIGEAA